jgi:hypothetical protein
MEESRNAYQFCLKYVKRRDFLQNPVLNGKIIQTLMLVVQGSEM